MRLLCHQVITIHGALDILARKKNPKEPEQKVDIVGLLKEHWMQDSQEDIAKEDIAQVHNRLEEFLVGQKKQGEFLVLVLLQVGRLEEVLVGPLGELKEDWV